MKKEVNFGPLNIIGIELRTTNDNGKAFEEIPLFWQHFYQSGTMEKIHEKSSDEIYAVYTNFENEGKDNNGMYSFIIGCPVNNLDNVPNEFISTTIPMSAYEVFQSEAGKPEKIVETWTKIWELSGENSDFDKKRTYICEFERYQSSGKINIYIGVK